MSGLIARGFARLSALAESGGAALVGFDWAALPAAINKIDWGIQTAANGVNVLRYIPPAEWPAILSGTSTYDATANIQTAINAGSVFVPDGLFNVSSISVNHAGRKIVGQSKNAILKRIDLTYLPVIVADGVDDLEAYGFTVHGNKTGNPLGLSGGLTPTAGGSPIPLENQGDIVFRNAKGSKVESVDFYHSFTSPVMFYNMDGAECLNSRSLGHAREGYYLVSGRDCKIDNCVSIGEAEQPWSLIASSGFDTDTWDHNHIVSNNRCFNSQAAFVTINTKGTRVFGNTIGKSLGLASTGPGIRLGHPSIPGSSAARSKVYDNEVFGIADTGGSGGTGRGISIEGANGAEVFDNRIQECRTGIGASVAQNLDIVVRDNSALTCTAIGYELFNVIGAKALNNISKDCPTGILVSGQNCTVTDNYVQNAATNGYNINAASGLNSGHVFKGNRTDSLTTNKWSVASPNLHTYLNNEYGTEQKKLIVVSGAVPSVIEGNLFNINNASATTVTSLGNWKEGAEYTLFFANSNSTLAQSGGSFRLKGGVNVTPSVGQVVKVLASGSLFYEISRSF